MTGPQIGLTLLGGVAVAAAVTVGVVVTRPQTSTRHAVTSQATPTTTTSATSSPSSGTALVAAPLPDPSCQQEPSLKSIAGATRFNLTFINNTNETLQTFWLDYKGKRVSYNKSIPAGTSYVQPTWITHPWIVADLSGTCLTLYTTDGRQASVSVPVGSVGPSTPQASPAAGPSLGNASVVIQATDALLFAPQTANARVGDIVEWDNGGTFGHNLTFDDASLAPSNDLTFNAGDKWQVKFSTSGTFTYQCTIHGGMTGSVVVR